MLRNLFAQNFKKVYDAYNYKIYRTNIQFLYSKYTVLNSVYNFEKTSLYHHDDFMNTLVVAEEIELNKLQIKTGKHELKYAKMLYDTKDKNLNLFIKIENWDILYK